MHGRYEAGDGRGTVHEDNEIGSEVQQVAFADTTVGATLQGRRAASAGSKHARG